MFSIFSPHMIHSYWHKCSELVNSEANCAQPEGDVFYLMMQNSKTLSRKCTVVMYTFVRLIICVIFLQLQLTWLQKEIALSRTKIRYKALFLFLVYRPNLHCCNHFLFCLGTWHFFQGNPYENMTTPQ